MVKYLRYDSKHLQDDDGWVLESQVELSDYRPGTMEAIVRNSLHWSLEACYDDNGTVFVRALPRTKKQKLTVHEV